MSENVKPFPKRRAMPQSLRFEVFKRDSFTCQYCGKKAPDVVLNVDHIKPVADGGENDILNLVTSCFDCNSGKGARLLEENSMLEKQRRQLEELNERRNQLEQMIAWREGLSGLVEEQIEFLQSEFLKYSEMTANEKGIELLRGWIKRFSFEEVVAAANKAFPQYVKDERKDVERWSKAFHAIPKIIAVERKGGMPPEKTQMFYIRGILRNRLRTVRERDLMWRLQEAYDCGVNLDEVEELAKRVPNWSRFVNELDAIIDTVMGR